jgi:hypothetical protein
MSKTVTSDDLNDIFYRSGYCRYRIYFLEPLYELAGFGEDGVQAEPGRGSRNLEDCLSPLEGARADVAEGNFFQVWFVDGQDEDVNELWAYNLQRRELRHPNNLQSPFQ